MAEASEPGLVVGIFGDVAAAESARVALERAGIPKDGMTLISPEHADALALASLSGVSRGEWQEYLDELDGAFLLVRAGTRDQEIQRVLRAQGADDVISATSLSQPATPPAPHRMAQVAPALARRIRPGMMVVSAERREVGRIDRIEGESLHVNRPLGRDLWVPMSAVADVIEQWVVLSLPFDQVDLTSSFLLKH